MRKILILAVILMGWLLLDPAIAFAQDLKVQPGDKIRVTYVGVVTTKTSGIMQGVSDDSLEILKGDATMALALSSIRRLDISMGQKRRTGRGAWIGALTGGLLVGLIAMASDTECTSDDDWCIDFFSPGEAFGGGFLVGALGGTLVGVAVGSVIKTDRWKQVPLDTAFDPVVQQSFYELSVPKIASKWSF